MPKKKEQTEESKILSDQIDILENQRKEVEALYGRHKQNIKTQIEQLQNARLVEKARLQDIENNTKAIEDEQFSIINYY